MRGNVFSMISKYDMIEHVQEKGAEELENSRNSRLQE